jgi:hypothetical protein
MAGSCLRNRFNGGGVRAQTSSHMAATVAVGSQFTWSPTNLRYRRTATGEYVSERAVKLAVRRVIRQSQAEMRALTELMNRREITLANWQERMRQELKNLHVSGAMAGAGGMANMTAVDYGRVGQRLRFEYRRLAQFARDVKARKLTRDQVTARVEMYVAGLNGTFEETRREKAIAAGFTLERNVLGKNENHCRTGDRIGCPELSAQGWGPIGNMPAPGRRQCLSRCFCRMTYRKRP